MMTTVAVLQPSYVPWIGYFNQMARADVFVLYDDVQYDKHGWRNRNRIKTLSNETKWLTVPIKTKGLQKPKIYEVQIDSRLPWQRKHLSSIEQNYAKSPFFKKYFGDLEKILKQDWDLLHDLNESLLRKISEFLNIDTKIIRSSSLNIEGDRNQRLLEICKAFDADCYLSGDAAKSYLDLSIFASENIEVCWHSYKHPQYDQFRGDFVPYLSIIDLLFNCGEESRNYVLENS